MKKVLAKITLLLFAGLFVFRFCAPCLVKAETGSGPYTTNSGEVIYMPYVADTSLRVYDYAELLSASDEGALRSEIARIEESKNCQLFILTSRDIPYDVNDGTETSRLYAEQFYIDNATREDGFIFLMDMNNRVIWTAGHGKYADAKYVDLAEEVYNVALPAMQRGAYFEAANGFLDKVNRVDNWLLAMLPSGMSLGISAVLSAIGVGVASSRHKKNQPEAQGEIAVKTLNYKQTGHRVTFLGKHTSSHRFVRNESGGESGGGFTGGTFSDGGFSGGGGSFSGGGGKF